MKMIDLDPTYLAMVKQILAEHAPDSTVWAYGSRVKGTAHAGSDLDLVIIDDERSNLSQTTSSRLQAAFSESNLPILVDIFNWTDIPLEFKSEIEKTHIVLQQRNS